METKTKNDEPRLSRYAAAGAPTKCFLPLCWRPFESTCLHGRDGHYYCSTECAEKGTAMDLTRVEELRPKTSAIPSTPKQKLFGRST
jgi:hypothetical protein